MAETSGTKRKRPSGKTKFYAVRAGKSPGIYNSWDECKAQIYGHKGAIYKAFEKLGDAQKFVAGESTGAPSKFYAVRRGKVPGIYTDWPSAQAQIQDWPKPRHKAFSTRTEAQQFLDEDEPKGRQEASEPEAKKARIEPEIGLLTEDGFDGTRVLDPVSGKDVKKTPLQSSATKLQASAPAPDSCIRIYTDGSSLGNGRKGAVAGLGVYFGPGDRRNLSEPLQGPRQTNQRAELTAIQRALDAVPRDRHVEIVTDSQYSISCLTNWFVNWRRNGWKNSAGKPVENKDLVEAIVSKIETREKDGAKTKFEWIKGHATDEGNIAADLLAQNGARAAATQTAGSATLTKPL